MLSCSTRIVMVVLLFTHTHTKSPLQDHPPSQQLKYFIMSSPPHRVAKRRHQSSPEYQFVFTVGLIVSLCGRRPVIFLLITMRSSRRTQHIHSQDRFTLMQLNGSSGGHGNTLRANLWTMDFDEYWCNRSNSTETTRITEFLRHVDEKISLTLTVWHLCSLCRCSYVYMCNSGSPLPFHVMYVLNNHILLSTILVPAASAHSFKQIRERR